MLKDLVPARRQERKRWPGVRPASPPPPTCPPLPPSPSQRRPGPSLGLRGQLSRSQVPQAALWDPRGGSSAGSPRSPSILPALLTGCGAPAWRPLGVHDGSWAGPGASSVYLRPAQRTDCRAPEHYLGPATRPLSRLPRPCPARVESPPGHLSAPANPSDPWTESPGASMAIDSGPWMPEASRPPSPHTPTNRHTRRRTGCKPRRSTLMAKRSAALVDPGKPRPY